MDQGEIKCQEGGRKLYNEELRDLYSSPSVNGMMKSRWMRWMGHVGRFTEMRACGILVERDH
jgi:hypothetical protein